MEEAFQGHSFCLEQGLGLNCEPKTGTNCTSVLNLEPNPNILCITENQTGVLGLGLVWLPTKEHLVNKAELEQDPSVSSSSWEHEGNPGMDFGLGWLVGRKTVEGSVRSAEVALSRLQAGEATVADLCPEEGRVADPHLCGWCCVVWVAQKITTRQLR